MKEDDIIFKDSEIIREYFKEDESKLDKVFDDLSEIQEKLHDLISNLMDNPGMRGIQKTLSDQIANFVSIQNQKQSILKDKRSIKENSLNIAIKNKSGENATEQEQIIGSLMNMIRSSAVKAESKVEQNELDLDEEIRKRLEQ